MSKVRSDAGAGALAGIVAGVAYLGAMAIDLKLFRHNTDDVYMLGRMATSQKQRVRPIGLAMHLVNSVIFGVAYARIAHHRLPGPPWLRGVTVANVENASLFTLAAFEKHHPGIRNGELDSYRTWTAFVQNVARHIVFGAVLGTVYGKLHSRKTVN